MYVHTSQTLMLEATDDMLMIEPSLRANIWHNKNNLIKKISLCNITMHMHTLMLTTYMVNMYSLFICTCIVMLNGDMKNG